MRSFQQIVALLFAFLTFALAQDYDATVYVTSTVYRVNTVTLSGTPTGSVANSTSTFSAAASAVASGASFAPSYSANATTVAPTGVAPSNSAPAFTGAASHLNVNAFIAVMAAGVGYLAL